MKTKLLLGLALVLSGYYCIASESVGFPPVYAGTTNSVEGTNSEEKIPEGYYGPMGVQPVLHIYAELTGADLKLPDGILTNDVLINPGRYPAMTRAEAIAFLEKLLREQAGIIVKHKDAKHVEIEHASEPESYTNQIHWHIPNGWQVSASNNVIVLRRGNPVWIMGKISNPPRMPDETEAAYFQRCGQQIRYELRLQFVPLLTQQEFEKLQTARQQAAAALKRGGSGKIGYDRLQREFENCQVPQFFTEKYSVYVEHWADITNNVNTTGYHLEPDFIDVYPPETVTEIKSLATSLKKMFQTYDADKP